MIQGYDVQAAVPFIARVMRKEGVRLPEDALSAFIVRALEADFAYMRENSIIDAEGYMGDGVYDDDDAFEALLYALSADEANDAKVDEIAQLLAAYMMGQEAFMDESGLME